MRGEGPLGAFAGLAGFAAATVFGCGSAFFEIAAVLLFLSALAGFAAPVFGGYILQRTGGDWNIFLYTMAGIYLIGTLCWPFIDPVTPVEQ